MMIKHSLHSKLFTNSISLILHATLSALLFLLLFFPNGVNDFLKTSPNAALLTKALLTLCLLWCLYCTLRLAVFGVS